MQRSHAPPGTRSTPFTLGPANTASAAVSCDILLGAGALPRQTGCTFRSRSTRDITARLEYTVTSSPAVAHMLQCVPQRVLPASQGPTDSRRAFHVWPCQIKYATVVLLSLPVYVVSFTAMFHSCPRIKDISGSGRRKTPWQVPSRRTVRLLRLPRLPRDAKGSSNWCCCKVAAGNALADTHAYVMFTCSQRH